jgi:hypothetical protein
MRRGPIWLETIRGHDFSYPLQIWRLTGIGILALSSLAMTACVAERFAPHRWRIHVALAAVSAVALCRSCPALTA